jgi:hypothetical protein
MGDAAGKAAEEEAAKIAEEEAIRAAEKAAEEDAAKEGNGVSGGDPPKTPEELLKDEKLTDIKNDPSLKTRAFKGVKDLMKSVGKNLGKILIVLLLGILINSDFEGLVGRNLQTEGECICNYERTKDLCKATPPAPYQPPSCANCDTGDPKICCRTCKDVLNYPMFFGIINLSFLGTTDILDLTSECKSMTSEECCKDDDVRKKRATDLVTSCLYSLITSLLPWIYGIIFFILLITFGPSLISIIMCLFGNSNCDAHLIIPIIAIGGGTIALYYSQGSEPSSYVLFLVGIAVCVIIAVIFGIKNIIKILSGGDSSGDDNTPEDNMQTILEPSLLVGGGGGEEEGEGGGRGWVLGIIAFLIFVVVVVAVICSNSSSSQPCSSQDPPSIASITKTPNAIYEIFLNDNMCLDDDDNRENLIDDVEYCYTNYSDMITKYFSGTEGLDNSPPVNCSSVESSYTSDQGSKKVYCLMKECDFTGGKCTTSASCDVDTQSSPESNVQAFGNYAKVAGEMAGEFIGIQVAVHGAVMSLSRVDKLLFRKFLTTIVEKIALEALLEYLDPFMWFGMALDFGDPCHYKAYVSNTDIKNNFRDAIDSSISNPSHPLFFPLSKLSVYEDSTDPATTPFKILYRGYISWTNYVNIGISELILASDKPPIEAITRAAEATTDNNYCSFSEILGGELSNSHKEYVNKYYSNSDIINQINSDEPSSLTTTSTDPSILKQIQLWKYIYRYCKNGGIYIDNKKLVLYNGEPTDGKNNLPNLWDNPVDGMPKLSSYVISTETLDKIKNLGSNGPVVTLSAVGARALQTLMNSYVTRGRPCGNAADKSDSCILDDIVISVSKTYRDYSNCTKDSSGVITNQPCKVIYRELPEELPLYYPSSSFVNTLCRYSTRGMKWISQRYAHLSPSNEKIMNALSGANDEVDNSTPNAIGKDYYDEETGLCNFNYNYCDSKACRNLYCYTDDVNVKNQINSPSDCTIDSSGDEKYVDCQNSWEFDAFSSIFGDTMTCGAIHLFEDDKIECP